MKQEKIYYIVWDANDPKRMKSLLEDCSMNESTIKLVMNLGLRTNDIIVPYETGYCTYSGYNDAIKNNPMYEEYTGELPSEFDETPDPHKSYKEEKITPESDKTYDGSPADSVSVVDLDDALDKIDVIEDEDEAFEIYSKVDEDYDEALDDLRVLLHVRDEYRFAEWQALKSLMTVDENEDTLELSFSILSNPNGGFEIVETEYPSVFSFATEKMTKKFLDNFEESLQFVSDSIGYFM